MDREHRLRLGLLVLRLTLGTLFFLHGWVKLFGNNISFVQEMLGMAGWSIPAWLLMIIAVFELVAGLAIAAGLLVPVMSWLLALEMLVAVVLFHARQGFFIVAVPNVPLAYGFEYHIALLGGLACLALAGPGEWSLERYLRASPEKAVEAPAASAMPRSPARGE